MEFLLLSCKRLCRDTSCLVLRFMLIYVYQCRRVTHSEDWPHAPTTAHVHDWLWGLLISAERWPIQQTGPMYQPQPMYMIGCGAFSSVQKGDPFSRLAPCTNHSPCTWLVVGSTHQCRKVTHSADWPHAANTANVHEWWWGLTHQHKKVVQCTWQLYSVNFLSHFLCVYKFTQRIFPANLLSKFTQQNYSGKYSVNLVSEFS